MSSIVIFSLHFGPTRVGKQLIPCYPFKMIFDQTFFEKVLQVLGNRVNVFIYEKFLILQHIDKLSN